MNFLRRERQSEAIACFRTSVELDENSEFVRRLGSAYYQSGQYAKAVEAGKLAAKVEPGNAEHYEFVGKSYQHIGDVSQAISWCRKALSIDENCIEARKRLDALGTVQRYERIAMQEPKSVRSQQNLLEVYRVMNMSISYSKQQMILSSLLKEAEPALRADAMDNPLSSAAQFQLGRSLFFQNRPLDSIKYLYRASWLDPWNASYHFWLARSFKEIGEVDEAIECCREAILFDHRHGEARRQLRKLVRLRAVSKEGR
jgi:tetratricopeptide (TPR) repeat protein